MLDLKPNWTDFAIGRMVENLYQKIESTALKREFAKHILGVAIELIIVTKRENPPKLSLVETLTDFRWHLHQTVYQFFPKVDDAALKKAVELSTRRGTLIIIVPYGYSEVLRNACSYRIMEFGQSGVKGNSRGKHQLGRKKLTAQALRNQKSRLPVMPIIYSLEQYIDTRICFTELDDKWRYKEAIQELFRRYNARVNAASCDNSILIEVKCTNRE